MVYKFYLYRSEQIKESEEDIATETSGPVAAEEASVVGQ